MSQDFDEVNLGTQITVGLNRLLARDLTALTKSSSQTTYPMSPIDGQLFCHTGNQEMNIRLGTSWTRIWGWKNDLPPFTANQLEANFQTLSDELTNISERGEQPFTFLASPYIPFNLTTSLEIFDCSTASDMRSYLQIGQLGTSGGAQIVNGQIQDGTIGAEKLAFDFNTDIPRAMESGDVKWTFNPSYDKSRFLLCDGKTIGSNQSNANYKGETYYNLFRKLGGSDSDWSTGKVVSLPNTTGYKTFVAHGEFPSSISSSANLMFAWRAVPDEGFDSNTLFYTANSDGRVEVEVIGGGGGASSGNDPLFGFTGLFAGGGGGGWFKGIISIRAGEILKLVSGRGGVTDAISQSSGDTTLHVYRLYGSDGETSTVEINGNKIVSCFGGTGGMYVRAGYGLFSSNGGNGGSVQIHNVGRILSSEYKVGFNGQTNGRGGCCGHGGQVDGSKYYAGDEGFVYPPEKPATAVGAGCEVKTNISDVSQGYVRIKDLDGVLQRSGDSSETTKSVEVINALCLIKL